MARVDPLALLQQLKERFSRLAVPGSTDRFANGYQQLKAISTAVTDDDGHDDWQCEDLRVESGQEGFYLVTTPGTAFSVIFGTGWAVGLFVVYPFFNTIPLFIGFSISLSTWFFIQVYKILRSACTQRPIAAGWSMKHRIALGSCFFLILCFSFVGFVPPERGLPILHPSSPDVPERYFIAANLYNVEAVFATWSAEVLRLSSHRTSLCSN